MKAQALRALTIYTGSDIFRVGSLLLYASLLLHIIMQVVSHQIAPSEFGNGAFLAVVLALLASLLRYFRKRISILLSQPFLLIEVSTAAAAIATFSLLSEFPINPTSWLIALAGVFPLVLK